VNGSVKAWFATAFTVFVGKSSLGVMMGLYGLVLVFGNVAFGALFDKLSEKKYIVYLSVCLYTLALCTALTASVAGIQDSGTGWWVFLSLFALTLGMAVSCWETSATAYFGMLFLDKADLNTVFAQRAFLESAGFAFVVVLQLIFSYTVVIIVLLVIAVMSFLVFIPWNPLTSGGQLDPRTLEAATKEAEAESDAAKEQDTMEEKVTDTTPAVVLDNTESEEKLAA
jgi:MFS family permease